MKYYSTVFLFLLTISISAQKIGDPFKTSRACLEDGIKLFDEKKYAEAIDEYNNVNPCDSNYFLALYESGLTYTQLKEYTKAIACCKKGLALNSSEERGFLDCLGSAYDYNGMQDSALYYYNYGIKKIPHYHKFYFETAISYIGKKNDSTALRYLIKSAMLNPMHAGTHLQLAKLAERNGFYTCAMLAYQYFFLLENNSGRALDALSEFQKLCNNNIEIVKTPIDLSKNGNNFSELDEIIKSRAAQIESYKTKVKIKYTDVIKQCQIISEKFKFDNSDKGFYNQFYGNLLSKAWQKGFFEAEMYSVFSGLNDEKVQEQVKKNEKDMTAFANFLVGCIDDYRQNIKHQIDGKDIDGKRYFYKNGTIEAVGEMTSGTKKTGKWYIYNSNGSLRNIGGYNNDEPDGQWTSFYGNRQKKNEILWSKGKRNGPYTIYFENGILQEKGTYVNNEIDGEVRTFFSNGSPNDITVFKNGLRNGTYTSYTFQGLKSATATYENDKVSGQVINYFKNGVVSEERMFKNGACTGPSKGNYISGEPSYAGSYKNDKEDGPWIWYFKNGKKSKEGTYAEGKKIKTWTGYYENGNVKEIFNYDNNELLDGDFKLYTRKGVLYNEGKYKSNKLLNMVFYDNTKKVIAETKNREDNYTFITYHPNGNIDEQGQVENKQRQGKFTAYFPCGAKASEVVYKNGKLDGISLKYFLNGQVSVQTMRVNDEYDGYFKTYYFNGILKTEGYYDMGKFVGPYITYYPDGALKEKYYYSNNDAIGYEEVYDAKGKLASRNYYSDIITTKQNLFDTAGNVFQVIDFKDGNVNVTRQYFNKKKHEEFKEVYGKKQGLSTIYHPNGKISETVNYFYGDKDGEEKEYDISGKLMATRSYKNEELEGPEILYDEHGKMEYSENYKEGNLSGKKTWYYENGKIRSEKNYVDNEIDSLSTTYSDDGTLASQLLYDDGQLIGYTYLDKTGKLLPYKPIKNETENIIAFYPNGKKSREINYVKGQVQGKRTMYYTNGQIAMEANFLDDFNDGLAKEFYPNGSLKSEANFKNGVLYGAKKTYYEDGHLENEANYVNDVKYGIEKVYDKTGKLITTYININGNSF